MWVVLHSLTYDICNLIVTAILHALHRMENTTLNRLESILQVWHSALEDNIRGVVQEPILVHTRKTAHTILGRGQHAILTLRSIVHHLLRINHLRLFNLQNILCILH